MKRILTAIFYSTVATTVAIALLVLTPDILEGNKPGMSISLAIVIAYGMSTFIGLLFVGLPTHFILQRFSISSALPYIFVGFVVPFFVVFVIKPFGLDPILHLIQQGIISGALGVICASVFWYFAARPNKSLKSGTPQSGAP